MPAACRGLRRTAPTRDWRSRGGSGGAVALLVEHAGCALAHGCLLASLEKGVVGLGRQVEQLALSLFDRLWERYRERVSYVNVYEVRLTSSGCEPT